MADAAGGDLLVSGGPLWAGPDAYWPAGALLARDGRVVYAGDAAGLPAGPLPSETLHAQGGLIMPGLVNAHVHGPMVLFRGLADDLPLEAWLFKHIFPAEARWMEPATVELCTRLAAAELLLSGVTTVCDAYFHAEAMARAYAGMGLRAVVAQGVIDFPAPGAPDPQKNLDLAREFVTAWQGRHALITPAIFAHTAYTCGPATLQGCARLAARLGAPWFIHLAESQNEVGAISEKYGRTPARHLEALGVLEGLTAAVHGAWLEPEEMALLARRGVAVAACPQSNCKLASGAADIPALLAAGVAVGLGTDGAASNNDLDILGEAALAARLAKLTTGDPAALPAATALDLALAGGAAALGLKGVVGRLSPGHAADLVVLKAHEPHLTPMRDPAAALVYQARKDDVRHVAVAGRVLVKDRQLPGLDLAGDMAAVRALAGRVANG
ncbi:MAG: amidohydrolase [Thermodesulfobacteriota bacterium]